MKKLIQSLKIIVYLIILWCIIHTVYVVADGLYDDGRTADVAVILGNKVNEDGTLELEVSPGSYIKIERASISQEWTAAINKPAAVAKA